MRSTVLLIFCCKISTTAMSSTSNNRKFNSFAILDLETANLPEFNYNKVGVTELSIYGIVAKELENRKNDGIVPKLPRVLHKLSLMINPRMMIVPDAEKVTGLDNYMLEYESPFDNNAAGTVLNFLKHLRQPVCLVAHNGWRFDFPIVKHLLDKVKQTMPETIYCMDSLRAFHDIDQERKKVLEDVEIFKEESEVLNTVQAAEKKFDARTQNETTPKRPTTSAAAAATKRKRNDKNKNDENSDVECDNLENTPPKSKRNLDFGKSTLNNDMNISYQMAPGKKWFPPKGIYKLGNIYHRTFKEEPIELHRAEADVMILTQLMLHYGEDFIDYAERHAITFQSVPRVGESRL